MYFKQPIAINFEALTLLICIMSIIGEKVFRINIFKESKKEINLNNISDGIYFMKVFDGEKSYCRKIIIEHN